MALLNKGMGARIDISLGAAGERPDFIPARIVGPVSKKEIELRNGQRRVIEVAPVITRQRNRETGEIYLGERAEQNLGFAFDRFELVEDLDGTEDEPKAWQKLVMERQAQLKAWLLSRPSAEGQAVSVDEV